VPHGSKLSEQKGNTWFGSVNRETGKASERKNQRDIKEKEIGGSLSQVPNAFYVRSRGRPATRKKDRKAVVSDKVKGDFDGEQITDCFVQGKKCPEKILLPLKCWGNPKSRKKKIKKVESGRGLVCGRKTVLGKSKR